MIMIIHISKVRPIYVTYNNYYDIIKIEVIENHSYIQLQPSRCTGRYECCQAVRGGCCQGPRSSCSESAEVLPWKNMITNENKNNVHSYKNSSRTYNCFDMIKISTLHTVIKDKSSTL